MNILISNVSNLESNELRVLSAVLMQNHNITVVSLAAAGHQKGSAFSYNGYPVKFKKINNYEIAGKKIDAYKFYGTPADMVSIMLNEIMAENKPDLVICGINNGLTLGTDTFCSSNIGMVMQSVFSKIPCVAVAVPIKLGGHTRDELTPPAQFIARNIDTFVKMGHIPNTFLNISCPIVNRFEDYRGFGVGSMDKLTEMTTYIEKTDCNGEKYYWTNFVTRETADEKKANITSGLSYFAKNYVIVSPLTVDCTDYNALTKIKETNKLYKPPKPEKINKRKPDRTTKFNEAGRSLYDGERGEE
jgi:5'-nucleotidase